MLNSNLIVTAILIVVGMVINLAMFDTLTAISHDPHRTAWVCIILWSAAIAYYATYLPLGIFKSTPSTQH